MNATTQDCNISNFTHHKAVIILGSHLYFRICSPIELGKKTSLGNETVGKSF